MNLRTSFLTAGVISILAGCGSDQPAPPPSTTAAPAPVAEAPLDTQSQGVASREVPQADASPQDLQAGIEAMKERVLGTVDAYSKVEPTPTFRYFMHPKIDQESSIELSMAGLKSVVLSPRIGDLSPECLSDPEAGIVEVKYALDDAAPTSITVDRNYRELIVLELNQVQKLKVQVGSGNGRITCDWLGLGVLNVTPS